MSSRRVPGWGGRGDRISRGSPRSWTHMGSSGRAAPSRAEPRVAYASLRWPAVELDGGDPRCPRSIGRHPNDWSRGSRRRVSRSRGSPSVLCPCHEDAWSGLQGAAVRHPRFRRFAGRRAARFDVRRRWPWPRRLSLRRWFDQRGMADRVESRPAQRTTDSRLRCTVPRRLVQLANRRPVDGGSTKWALRGYSGPQKSAVVTTGHRFGQLRGGRAPVGPDTVTTGHRFGHLRGGRAPSEQIR